MSRFVKRKFVTNFFHKCIASSVYLLICALRHLCIASSVHCVICALRHLCIASSVHCVICALRHPCIASSMYCFIHVLLHPCIASSMYCFIHVLLHPCIASSMYCTLGNSSVSLTASYNIFPLLFVRLGLIFMFGIFTFSETLHFVSNSSTLNPKLHFFFYKKPVYKKQGSRQVKN